LIVATSDLGRFQTSFASATSHGSADAPIDKGGGGVGFDPHELLEAAVATCINIFVRKRATQLGIAIDEVRVVVRLVTSRSEASAFVCELQLVGAITEEHRAFLIKEASHCPVTQTLTGEIVLSVQSEHASAP
jgi:putative redox protein